MKAIRNSYSIRVPSPDGTIFVHCIEKSPGILEEIDINIGKSGSSVLAWANGLSRMINLALKHQSLSDILSELSLISSDKSVYGSITNVTSGVNAVFQALVRYNNLHSTNKPYTPPKVSIPERW